MNPLASTGEDSTSAETGAQFVHLHTHSEFSLAEGLLKVKSAVDEATQRNIPAMALTDRNNLFALVNFVKPVLLGRQADPWRGAPDFLIWARACRARRSAGAKS